VEFAFCVYGNSELHFEEVERPYERASYCLLGIIIACDGCSPSRSTIYDEENK
jgi:hypothetical protein